MSSKPPAPAALGGRPRLTPARALVVLLVVLGAWLYLRSQRPTSDELVEEGWRLLYSGEHTQAEQLARQVLQDQDTSSTALFLAASAAMADGRYDDAIGYCERVRRDQSRESIEVDALCGEMLFRHRKLMDPAEGRLLGVVAREPGHLAANGNLVQLLALQTRARDLIPFQLRLIRSGSVDATGLYALCAGDKLYPGEDAVRAFHEADVEAPGPLLAVAQLALFRQDVSRARRALERAVLNAPGFPEAQARLGRLLLDHGSDSEFLDWHQALPRVPEVQDHPAIWEARGLWSARHGDAAGAARCLWEALRRDANRVAVNYQLGQTLVTLGRPGDAAAFFKRAELLEEYRLLVEPARANARPDELTPGRCRQAAVLCRRLGLVWEEFGWAVLAARFVPPLSWAEETRRRLAPQLDVLPLVRAPGQANPALRMDLSGLKLPDFVRAGTVPFQESSAARIRQFAADSPRVRFADRAAEAGIEFAYYNDGDPNVEGMARAFEFTGGGVAVLDYDCDGWPDLYFPQGAVLPRKAGAAVHRDRFFRNLGDGRFVEVTDASAVFEDGYSQGATVGDLNSDGFADLFVANIGRNRLFQNNGDGTFVEISHVLQPDAERWTTSAAIADLTGDALPEICAVNYLQSPDLLTRVCRDRAGPRTPCTPRDFDASLDQLYWNAGDGSFQEVTSSSGIERPDGKGLGLVVADFAGTGHLSVFVANDGTANFLFENRSGSPGAPPAFEERALVLGLAYSETGNAQACMGVVAEDFNADGALDLFVTNFHDEYNTLYVQRSGNLFADESRRSGLAQPSLKWLGFGAQSIDADLDGLPDLVVTNGHVDNYTHAGIAWQMPPQFFWNAGSGRFVELRGSDLGPYFERAYLGRGMARVDWNRDGAEDVVVTHLDAPAALVTNETIERGHFIAVQLRGTRSNRDAIGTTVAVETGDRRLIRQLVAGDGYESSNERRLVLGLGSSARPVSLHVRWPSGAHQQFDSVAVDQELMIVEGCQTPLSSGTGRRIPAGVSRRSD